MTLIRILGNYVLKSRFNVLIVLPTTSKTNSHFGLCTYRISSRSIAAATNYFILRVPEATIRGRRLFEGGVNKRILSYNYFYYSI